jgi:hypothetical protein
MRLAPAKQWQATIRNVKDMRGEEIARSRLNEFLQSVPPEEKLSKASLINCASENLSKCKPVLLTERMNKYRPDLFIRAFDPSTIPKRIRESFTGSRIVRSCELASFGYKILGAAFEDMYGTGTGWFVYDNRWRPIPPSGKYMNSLDAIDAAYTAAKGVFSDFVSSSPANKYERYSLLGRKEQYREWLAWLPKWKGGYINHHFGVKNLVLHLRTSVRHNEDGYPMLLVDEIQSDWHALGRDYGYLGDAPGESTVSDAVPDAPFIKEWHELGIKIAVWIAVKSGVSTVGFTTGDTQCKRWGKYGGLRTLYDDLIPNSLDKLRGKFGGFLYWADVSVRKPEGEISPQEGLGWAIPVAGNQQKQKIVKNEVVAMRYWQAGVETTEEEVLAFDISAELAAIVKTKGIPMFGWWEISTPKLKTYPVKTRADAIG